MALAEVKLVAPIIFISQGSRDTQVSGATAHAAS
jgi:hypothetical protein